MISCGYYINHFPFAIYFPFIFSVRIYPINRIPFTVCIGADTGILFGQGVDAGPDAGGGVVCAGTEVLEEAWYLSRWSRLPSRS